jgi:hypothetical protein
MKKIVVLVAFVAFILQNSIAQNIDSATVTKKRDPSVLVTKKSVEDSFPNPRKAFLWSIIPGGGQIYNKKLAWLKLPLVYGALGTGVYFINFTTTDYRRFKLAYSQSVNKEPYSDPTIPQNVDPARLKQLRDFRFKQVQQAYVLTAVAYLLAGVEAFTAAHLAHFDVKDDLSLHLKPSFEPVPLQGNAVGFGIQLRW